MLIYTPEIIFKQLRTYYIKISEFKIEDSKKVLLKSTVIKFTQLTLFNCYISDPFSSIIAELKSKDFNITSEELQSCIDLYEKAK